MSLNSGVQILEHKVLKPNNEPDNCIRMYSMLHGKVGEVVTAATANVPTGQVQHTIRSPARF
jgi:hypothetical protein